MLLLLIIVWLITSMACGLLFRILLADDSNDRSLRDYVLLHPVKAFLIFLILFFAAPFTIAFYIVLYDKME